MVYGVFREQYSGRNVEGYFLNGEDAYKYCAYKIHITPGQAQEIE